MWMASPLYELSRLSGWRWMAVFALVFVLSATDMYGKYQIDHHNHNCENLVIGHAITFVAKGESQAPSFPSCQGNPDLTEVPINKE